MRSVQIKGYGNNEVIEINRNAPVPSDPSAADNMTNNRQYDQLYMEV